MRRTPHHDLRSIQPAILCASALLAFCALSPFSADAAGPLSLESVSNRPDKLSGDDALIRVHLPANVAAAQVTVTLNGLDVTGAFLPEPGGDTLLGLVEGLDPGKNRLQAKAKGVGTGNLELINHPISGPIFSGPHQQPFFCETAQFTVYPGGGTLGSALDEDCTIPTRIDYLYRSTGGAFLPLTSFDSLPGDLAMTTTTEGDEVPYIVRLETGTINRAVYQLAMLDDPEFEGPDLLARDGAWNGRLVYTFGGGCRGGWYRQGASTGGVLNDMMLSKGFAVASASLNVFANNCSDLLSAETMMMVKERFIEVYNRPDYTIGWGCSGGSYQVHQIGDNYPGLLDGIIPQCSFPEVGFATIHTLADSRLFWHYYNETADVDWTEEELRAASGFNVFNTIPNLDNGAARIDPVPDRPDGRLSAEFNAVVDEDVRYDPGLNPDGARATVYDHTINAYGRDPRTGFARRPLDNIGIQYGLEALNQGLISKEQFLDLNDRIGGMDIDANFIPERMSADRLAMRAAYQTGRLLSGGGGLAAMPILDYDLLYTDQVPDGDIHLKFHHFSTRERLINANGHADNHIMWSGGGTILELITGAPTIAYIQEQALLAMDQWLANIAADPSNAPRAEKVVDNIPVTLTDGCWDRTGFPPTFIVEPQTYGGPDTSPCNDIYPAYPSPRMVAGGPLASDIIKCRLKPVDYSDYVVVFTPEEQSWLESIFARGVCDWSRPGVEQQPLLSTWVNFIDEGRYQPDTPMKP